MLNRSFLCFLGILGILGVISVRADGFDSARGAMEKVRALSHQDDAELEQLSQAWQVHCGTRPEADLCLLTECDLNPNACRKNRILLFRGEDQLFPLPSSSALLRTRLNLASYGRGLSPEKLLQKLSHDLNFFKTYEDAPQAEPELLIQNGVPSQTRWVTQETRDPLPTYPHPEHLRRPPFIAYSFHVEASFFFFEDPLSQKQVGIDPLISTSTSPRIGASFGRPHSSNPLDQGRLIVYSVPSHALRPLCHSSTRLQAETVLDPRRCSDLLNEHSDELEFDIVLNPDPDWIYRVFLLSPN